MFILNRKILFEKEIGASLGLHKKEDVEDKSLEVANLNQHPLFTQSIDHIKSSVWVLFSCLAEVEQNPALLSSCPWAWRSTWATRTTLAQELGGAHELRGPRATRSTLSRRLSSGMSLPPAPGRSTSTSTRGVRYIDKPYRLSIYRHFMKISISISISIRSLLKISISISISIRTFLKISISIRSF